MGIKLGAALVAAFFLSACVHEVARFQAQPGQETVYRDGNPAIVSRKASSIVMAQPASRRFQVGVRPVYVVAIFNPGKAPINFAMSGVAAYQMKAGQPDRELKVYTYEQLVAEEQAKQVARAIFVGVAAGLNAASAANAGRYHAHGTVYGPSGVSRIHVSGYSPVANAIAQANASAQNEAMIGNAIATGQHNMAQLEQGVLKDNTMMPGEWYGGQVHFDVPFGEGEKNYRITIQVGPDRHEIDVAHEQAT